MFGNDWDNVLKDIMDEKWFCDLIEEVKKEYKILIIISSLLIILSTLFIKQHVVVDVLGALLIVPIYYILRKRKINLEESGIYAKIFCQK